MKEPTAKKDPGSGNQETEDLFRQACRDKLAEVMPVVEGPVLPPGFDTGVPVVEGPALPPGFGAGEPVVESPALPLDINMADPPEKTKKRKRETRLTAADIKTMSASEIGRLNTGHVGHITMKDLVKAGVSPENRVAFRGITGGVTGEDGLIRQKEWEKGKEDLYNDGMKAFNAICHNVRLAPTATKHSTGGGGGDEWHQDGDNRFQEFLQNKKYTVAELVDIVVNHRDVGQYCTFADPERGDLYDVTIDLAGFFRDDLLRRMTIYAGITEKCLRVYHVGPSMRR